ncbi:MAG TPA: carboxypeptidase regulatory-like domain-containing protein [Vicinamibacterales bacterium]|nr:carboxypeptidase regulatory-like domain-containing protein [Vicinamibacterales bacterium]
MSRAAMPFCVVLLAFSLENPTAQQPPTRIPLAPEAADLPAGGVTLSGRVVSAADGRVLRGAEVAAANPRVGARSTLTDGDGRFELPGLIPGPWTVTISKAGFVTQQSGQRHPSQPARPFQISGDRDYTVEFALVRGGVVAGTIVDQFGEAVAGAQVDILRSRMVRGRRQLAAVASSDVTDDAGAFRLHSLPAGDYYITASLRAAPSESELSIASRQPTYFPGTPNATEAQRVTLSAGEERSGVIFPIVPPNAVRVSGTVVNAAGMAVEGASVELLNASDFSVAARAFGNFGQTYENGRFTMLNVAPGSYVLSASVARPTGAESAFLPINVGVDEVSGATLVASRGATVTGSIAAIPGSTLPPLTRVTVSARSMRSSEVRTASLERGTAFTLRGLAGPYAIGVDGLPTGWGVASIDLDGSDVADGARDFPAAGQFTARIVLTNRLAEVTGVVSSNREPAPDVDVVIFPDDAGKWTYPSRLVRAAKADASGRFRITGLPPASRYLAIALDYLEQDEYQDTELLDRVRARATAFSVGESENASIELTLVRR